jgi:hypothetical protein
MYCSQHAIHPDALSDMHLTAISDIRAGRSAWCVSETCFDSMQGKSGSTMSVEIRVSGA